MQSPLYLLLSISILFNVIEGAWNQNTIPVTNINFVSTAFSSISTCVMVGYNDEGGAIIRSTDGGSSWSTIDTTVTQTADVDTITISSTVYYIAVAVTGEIYVSTDGGATFPKATTLSAALYGVAIGSNQNAFAVGATTSVPAASKLYRSVYSAGSIYVSWTEINTSASTSVLVTAVTSFDGTNVIAVGYSGYIYYSNDAGDTFTAASTGLTANFQCVSSASATYSMLAGDSATILVTKNGGSTWTSVASGLPSTVTSSTFKFHAISVGLG